MRDVTNIVAIVPRGEVIRNFEYSGTFEQISSRAGLSLLAVSMNSGINDQLLAKYSNVFPLDEVHEAWIVRFQREILDTAHGRWLWSRAAQERWRIRDLEAKTLRERLVRKAKKLICRPFSNRFGLGLLTKSERTCSRMLANDHRYRNLYKRLKPALVFNGSHVHSRNATYAVQSAQWLGIPTATFIFSWDNLTSQGRIMLPYDYFLVWNETLKVQLLEMYDWIKPEQVFVTGSPQFDFHFRPEFYLHREEYCQKIGADPQRPIIFYATGMANHMPGEPEIVEGIADMFKSIDPKTPPQLVVRVYPKDNSTRFDEVKRRRRDILFLDSQWDQSWLTPRFEDSYDLINAIRHCSIGINVASTISLELCMFDKPVINVGYNPPSVDCKELSYADYYEFDHFKSVVESGAVQVADSKEEMKHLIMSNLASPETRKSERQALIKSMFGSSLDGKSGIRVAEILLMLAKK